jgi:ribosomal 50S subunit-associated protein YjgA (DUF615 family)
MIYTYLRHHYVLSRSIVVIADEEFSSFYFQNLANQITKSLLDKLAPQDYFGCIHMTKFLNDYIKLEEKEYNLQIKQEYLREIQTLGKVMRKIDIKPVSSAE